MTMCDPQQAILRKQPKKRAAYDWGKARGDQDKRDSLAALKHIADDTSHTLLMEDSDSQFGESVRRLQAVGVVPGSDAEKMLDAASNRSSRHNRTAVPLEDMDSSNTSKSTRLRKMKESFDTISSTGNSNRSSRLRKMIASFDKGQGCQGVLDGDESEGSYELCFEDSDDEKQDENSMNRSYVAPDIEEGSTRSLVEFFSCHSFSNFNKYHGEIEITFDDDSDGSPDMSIASFGIEDEFERYVTAEPSEPLSCAEVDGAEQKSEKHSTAETTPLVRSKEDVAARRIQRFLRFTIDWYKEEVLYLQAEKKDVLRRQEEELASIQLFLETEKQQALLEIQAADRNECESEIEEDASKCTFDFGYFASLEDHRNELRRETRGYLELKTSVRSLILQNKRLSGLAAFGIKAMKKARKEVAKVEVMLQKERAKSLKIQDCIIDIASLMKSRTGKDEKVAKGAKPNQTDCALTSQSADERKATSSSLPVDAPIDSHKARPKTKSERANRRSSDDFYNWTPLASATTEKSNAAQKAENKSKSERRSRRSTDASLSSCPKSKADDCKPVQKDKEARTKPEIESRHRRSSDTDLVIAEKPSNGPVPFDWNSAREGGKKKRPMRRQRSKSLTESGPRLGVTRAREGQNKRNSMRRMRSKSYSDVTEAAKNKPARLEVPPIGGPMKQANEGQGPRNGDRERRRGKGPMRRQRSKSLSEAELKLEGSRARESQNKRKSIRRQRSKSYSNVIEAAKDDLAPPSLDPTLWSAPSEQATTGNVTMSVDKQRGQTKRPMRRQRSRSLTEVELHLGGKRAKEIKGKRKSMRRQRSKSYSDVTEAAKDNHSSFGPGPTPLCALIEQATEGPQTTNNGRVGRQAKRPMRRQRSKSLSEAKPQIGERRTKEGQNKRKSMRRQRSKSYSDVTEAANDDPAPLLSLIEMKGNNQETAALRRVSAVTGITVEQKPKNESLRARRHTIHSRSKVKEKKPSARSSHSRTSETVTSTRTSWLGKVTKVVKQRRKSTASERQEISDMLRTATVKRDELKALESRRWSLIR